nr:hypothetical protein [Tanacetum cinerariifolium]
MRQSQKQKDFCFDHHLSLGQILLGRRVDLSRRRRNITDMPEGMLVLSGLSRVWKSRVYDLVLRGVNGNVMGIYDFLCLPEWTGAEVQEEPQLDVRPTLQRLLFYCTPPTVADDVIPDPALEDLAVGTPISKIVSKAEVSQKQKFSTSDAALSHVAKRTRVGALLLLLLKALTPEGKGVMVDDVVASSAGASLPRPSSGPAPSFRDVFGDAIHTDFFPFFAGPYYATYPKDGVVGNYKFTRKEWDAPYQPTFGVLTKEVFKDLAVCNTIIDQIPTPGEMTKDEFVVVLKKMLNFILDVQDRLAEASLLLLKLTMPFLPTFGVLTKEVFKDLAVCNTIIDQIPTPGEMVRVESLFDDQLTTKMSVLNCMIMSHGGKLLARCHGLNQSHHEYVLSTDSRLKGYEEKVANLTGLELHVAALNKQLSGLNDKLTSSDASFSKSKATSKNTPFTQGNNYRTPSLVIAKKDMDMHHSRITQDDLDDLIIKYKIPRDLHPRLPSGEFVMSALPDDAIDRTNDDLVWGFPDFVQTRPTVGSFSMVDVRRLSAHVIKLRDMPKGVLVLSRLSCVWKRHVCDLVLRGADGNASQKRKASTSGATSSHVAKRTRSALAQSSGSTTRPSLFVGDSDDESNDDDDAYVEISLVTPLRSAAVIHSLGTRVGALLLLLLKVLTPEGKGIMADDAAAPSVGVSRPRPSSGSVPLFRDVSRDAIHADFFPFSAGPYYATYPQDGVAGNYEFTPLSEDQLTAKMSVLHCMMIVGNKMHKAFPLPVIEFPLPVKKVATTRRKEKPLLFRIQQYLQHEHYALWEVIDFGDSYEVPASAATTETASDGTGKKTGRTVTLTAEDMQKRKNDVKARNTLLLSLPDEHQLRFSKYKTTQELWATILKTFGGNEATKKTKKNLLKQQYSNFKAKGSETLEQTFNRLQVIVGQLQFMDRSRSDLDTMSLDDMYNHLKVYESEVQKKSEPNFQNMTFISSAKHSRGNKDVNTASVSTASVSTASINVPTASANVGVASISQDTGCTYIASQSSGSQIKFEDINQIDEDDMEEMDIKWSMTHLSMRADKF